LSINPQHLIPPERVTAQVWLSPLEIDVTPEVTTAETLKVNVVVDDLPDEARMLTV
jgi:hypothetical protein